MALKSIDEANYDETVVVKQVDETVQGQAQTVREPDNGEVKVNETKVKLDTVIIDPHHELAVQALPEGSNVGFVPPAAQAFKDGTAEEQFAAADGESGASTDASDVDQTVPVGPGTETNAGNQSTGSFDGLPNDDS